MRETTLTLRPRSQYLFVLKGLSPTTTASDYASVRWSFDCHYAVLRAIWPPV
jgi:hypothetical protein